MKRNLICIICPKGCPLTAEGDEKDLRVTGNTCPRGEQYAINECLHPVRTVTATVRVANRQDTMVSVKTQDPVPKEKMPEVMGCLRKLTVNAPVSLGDALPETICGSRIIITKAVE